MTTVIVRLFAEEGLLSIAQFIARDIPQRAKTFLQELEMQIDRLSEFPDRCQIVEAIGDDIRQLIYKKYRIFYRYEQPVEIVHMLRVIAPFQSIGDLPLNEKMGEKS